MRFKRSHSVVENGIRVNVYYNIDFDSEQDRGLFIRHILYTGSSRIICLENEVLSCDVMASYSTVQDIWSVFLVLKSKDQHTENIHLGTFRASQDCDATSFTKMVRSVVLSWYKQGSPVAVNN